jgi:hypothetical protein
MGEAAIVGVDVGVRVSVDVTVGISAVAVVSDTCGWGEAIGAHETVRPKRTIGSNTKCFILLPLAWCHGPVYLSAICVFTAEFSGGSRRQSIRPYPTKQSVRRQIY